MKIKEFSQKHSVSLFWTTIVLLIVSIVLGSYFFCGNSPRKMKNFGGDFENRGMMQRGFQDESGSRGFNRGNFQNQNNQVAPINQVQGDVTPQDGAASQNVNQ